MTAAGRASACARDAGRVVLLAALLALAAGSARAQGSDEISVLVFPMRSHWLSAPLADAVTAAVVEALSGTGYPARLASPDVPGVQRAIAEGWVDARELGGNGAARSALAVAMGAKASLAGEVVEEGGRASLRARLAGAISRKEVILGVEAPTAEGREQAARELAQGLARAITPAVWAQAGADDEGRRLGASQRAAAGRQALEEGRARDALIEFDAAVAGDPDRPEYLLGDAEAYAAAGDYAGALRRMRRVVSLRPDDASALVRMGDLGLTAGEPDDAEGAFLKAQALDPADLQAMEGLARTARAKGDEAAAVARYGQLIEALRGRGLRLEEPLRLAGILARQPDDSIRLAGLAADAMARQVARAYMRAGEVSDGVRALLDYHALEGRPAYTIDEYLSVAAGMDEESERIARRMQAISVASDTGRAGGEEKEMEAEALHTRSDRLATLAERMTPPALLEAAHRYRVLAYNLLNESNFEALLYFRTRDRDRQRRADVLREHCRRARATAQDLQAALLETESGQ